MFKRILSLAICGAIVMAAFTGCGSTKTSVKSEDKVTKVDKSQQLVIYSNSAGEGRGEWLTERAAKEGYKIQVVSIPGGELTNRLVAEKNNSLADLVYGLNSVEYEKLKQNNLLLKYKPVWASEVDMKLGDSQGYYYPTVVQPLVLVYNTQYKDVPKDWTDLTDAKYKDKYTLLALSGGTAKSVLASILVRYADPKGELGISKEGWDVVKALIKNGHIEVSGENTIGKVVDGSRPMAMQWGSGVIQNQTKLNVKFGVMSPEIGVPYVTEQVAIISKTKKAALAEDFANWFGSAEIQAEWSQKFGTIPVNPKALEKASDDTKKFMQSVHVQNIDWSLVSKNMDKWMEKIQLEFVK